MNFKNLKERHGQLIQFLESNNYCTDYIKWFQYEINWILEESAHRDYQSYEEIFYDRISRRAYSKSTVDMKKTIIGTIKRFDLEGKYPDGRCGHCMLKAGPERALSDEFQKIIDPYRESVKKIGKTPETLRTKSSSATTFFLFLQKCGENTLDSITEKSVLRFFEDYDSEKSNGYYFRERVAAVLGAWEERDWDGCRRVKSYLPQLRPFRKNLQYLTDKEVSRIRKALDDPNSCLTLRDRAIGMLLLYTGLRSCDIAGITFDAIDWGREVISIVQEKTGVPLELPLSPIVGNAIYDYLTLERADMPGPYIFLTGNRLFNPISVSSIDNIVDAILRESSNRQSAGDRRGAHLFRHNVATSLMGNGVPRPVISGILGHSSPDALGTYLHADFAGLKACSLDVSMFPVGKEVFGDA